MRHSRQRELILDIITGNTTHPTADAIYVAAREREPNISLGTVYRNLKVLAEDNKLVTLETQDKKIHYDYNVLPHGHFICDRCGKIYDMFYEDGQIGELNARGFSVSGAKCVYYGVCAECGKREKN